MAAAEGSMGVAVTLPGAILVAVAMDGVAAVMGAAGTVVVAGMDEVGTVGDMGAVGMVVVRIGMAVLPTGGVTRTRMVTVMVGKSASGQGSPVVSLSRRRPAVPGRYKRSGRAPDYAKPTSRLCSISGRVLRPRAGQSEATAACSSGGIRRLGTGGEESGRAGARPYRVLPHVCDERARNRYHLRKSASICGSFWRESIRTIV